MEFFTPFAGPYVNGPPFWHHGGYFDRSFHDDSGYASGDDSDSVPFISLDPDIIYGDTDQLDQYSPWIQRHRAAAFVDAQWSRPGVFRACHPFHDPSNDSCRTYDLPQPLPFVQRRSNRDPGSWPKPTTSSNRESFGRERSHTASRRDFRTNASPLDVEEHRSRIPNTLPSLNNRISSETEQSSPSSSSSTRHHSLRHSPDVRSKARQSRSPTTSAQSNYGHSKSIPSSPAPRERQHQPPTPNHEQLAASWQQLYQERKELEREKRNLKRKEKKSLRQRSRRDCSDDMADDCR